MSKPVSPIPEQYHTATPYLIAKDAAKALEFYKTAFGAEVLSAMKEPSGKIGHAEIRIGDSIIMLADEYPEMKIVSPVTLGGTPVSILLYVEKVDDTFAQAIAAGATVTAPLENKFYGDRMGCLKDPFGHSWYLASRIEILTDKEIQERMAKQDKQPN